MRLIGFYIHIPFCASKCSYCALYSGAFSTGFYEQYFVQLCNEISSRSKYYKNYTVNTIYIGGGTPSCVNPDYIKKVFEAIYSNYSVLDDVEISIEINPESFNQDKLEHYLQFGINRFSFGVQSFDDSVLQDLNRKTTVKDIEKALIILSNCKVNNYNFDVMYGFPGLKSESLRKTMAFITSSGAKHVSVYNYSLESPSLMATLVLQKRLKLPANATIKTQNRLIKGYLCMSQFKQYEISNYAQKGFECRHNVNFWRGNEYLGFGVSAVSFVNRKFLENVKNISEYVKLGYNKNRSINRLTRQELDLKNLLLGIRLNDGVNLKALDLKKDSNIMENIQSQISKERLVLHETPSGGNVRLTEKGQQFFDLVCSELASMF